ncbi:hypothetical protein K443DRAFT_90499, partial [Laccaria amethystina LaAM-08-1]
PVLTGQDQFILTGLVFCSLGPVWLWSFSSHETGLPNTTPIGLSTRTVQWPIDVGVC